MYKIEIFYSAEDEGYIAVAPELPGCSAFGETEEAALEEIKTAQELWLETAQDEGRTIPVPKELPTQPPEDHRDKQIYRIAKTAKRIRTSKQCILA